MGYLVIEKPITFDEGTLRQLLTRPKTAFFIDEAYLKMDRTPAYPEIVDIFTLPDDAQNCFEHALGLFFQADSYISYEDVIFRHTISESFSYHVVSD
jgi:hypothetical protein